MSGRRHVGLSRHASGGFADRDLRFEAKILQSFLMPSSCLFDTPYIRSRGSSGQRQRPTSAPSCNFHPKKPGPIGYITRNFLCSASRVPVSDTHKDPSPWRLSTLLLPSPISWAKSPDPDLSKPMPSQRVPLLYAHRDFCLGQPPAMYGGWSLSPRQVPSIALLV